MRFKCKEKRKRKFWEEEREDLIWRGKFWVVCAWTSSWMAGQDGMRLVGWVTKRGVIREEIFWGGEEFFFLCPYNNGVEDDGGIFIVSF